MTLSDTLATLAEQGVHITAAQLDYAIRTGRIGEVEFDGAGNRQFGAQHLAAIRRYAERPRRRGRTSRRSDAALEVR